MMVVPKADEVWYVQLHHCMCSVRLDTVLVKSVTPLTCELIFIDEEPDDGGLRTERYRLDDVSWVEKVRTLPRTIRSESCPTNAVQTSQVVELFQSQGPARTKK